jgi:hypothetical protein
MKLTGTGVLAVAALAAVGVGGYFLWKNREWFNVSSDKNLASQGASAFVEAVTGGAAAGGESSVGGLAARFREWVSGDDDKIRDMLKGSTPKTSLVDGRPVDSVSVTYH